MKFLKNTHRAIGVAALALTVAVAGCSAQGTDTGSISNGTVVQSTAASSSSAAATTDSASPTTTSTETTAKLAASIADSTHFDADDLEWDQAKETTLTLSDSGSKASGTNASSVKVSDGVVNISGAGDYRISGSLSNGKIVVSAGEEDVVRIILNGVTISNSTGSAIEITSANEVLLFMAEGSKNTLSDASTYSDTADDAANAAVYSKADLTLAGPGQLSVNGNYQDGITSKDGLVLAAGNVSVKAADDGIKGKDYLVQLGGNYTVDAAEDAFKSTNTDDSTRGWVLLAGGDLKVAAGDDGIKAATTLTISGGTQTVSESEEAVEAPHIKITGGTLTATANDDGINAAAAKTTDSESDSGNAGGSGGGPGGSGGGMGGGMGGGDTVGDQSIDISGGTVTINAEGDGLDSNGNATISGGTVVINGPTNGGNGALDVNGELLVSGGTLVAAGSAGMAVAPSAESKQSSIQATFSGSIAAGTVVHVVDSSNKVVASFTTSKQIQSLVFSSAAIVAGQQYSVYTGGTASTTKGLGTGSITGANKVLAVTAGEYTSSGGFGGRP